MNNHQHYQQQGTSHGANKASATGPTNEAVVIGNRYPISSCRKVFVHRDYSQGLPVRFHTKLPPELDGKVEEGTWERTMTELNRMYMEGEKVGARSAAETLLGCFTCYIAHLCITQQYDRALQRISRYLKDQNESVYIPKGIFITDPIERGLRVVEISILTEPSQHAPPMQNQQQQMPMGPPANATVVSSGGHQQPSNQNRLLATNHQHQPHLSSATPTASSAFPRRL